MEPEPLASGPRRVEAYLDQILAPLTRRLSPLYRDELRRELRENLWARIEAYRELDHSETEAVTEALRQFGGAEDFLHQWGREWKKAPSQTTLGDIYKASKQALRPALLGPAIAILPFPLLQASFSFLRGSPAGALLESHRNELFWALQGFALLMLPIIIGARHGRRRSPRTDIGLIAILTIEAFAVSALYAITTLSVTLTDAENGWFFVVLGVLTTWIPVAGGVTAVSRWWMQRSQIRRLA